MTESIVQKSKKTKVEEPKTSISSMNEFRREIKKKFYEIIDLHVDRIETIFSAFKFGSIQEIIEDLYEKHMNYSLEHEEKLQEFLNIQVSKRLEFKDESYLKYDKVENLFQRNLKGGVRQPMIANLLTEQRLLNVLDLEDPELLRTPVQFYDFRERPANFDAKQRINLFTYSKTHEKFFAFCSDNKGYILDKKFNKEEITTLNCRNMCALKCLDRFTVLGNKNGDFFLCEDDQLTVSYRYVTKCNHKV
jgi:hypothetical protein